MRLAPKIASNRSWFNDSTLDFFRQRAVSLRGTLDGNTFTARTIWPRDYTITPSTAQFSPLRSPDELQAWVRADHGGARSQFAARLIWKRPCVQTAWSNKPVLAVMLNGAQGDDDEAHGGHFAIATGKLGPQGEWSDWLVNNFYNLDNVSEKGIIASMTPMDAYLMDLNSGQSYYRPSWLLVAVLRSERTAAAYQQGIQRTFEHFYRHAFTYQHAAANCAGISVDMLRSLGWHIPPQGPTGRMQAIGAYAYMAASDASLQSGRKAYDYFSEEQTRLYPAVAFDAIGRDLLAVLGGQSGRTLSAFERQLHEDVEAVLLLRVPQVPSSRASGSAPVYSIAEYRARTPQDRSKWQIVPTEPRPFPAELREGVSISRAAGQPVPLPVAMLLVVVIGAAGAGAIWRRPVSAAQGRAALAPRAESRSKDQESQTGS
ncbi:hypothetical protein ACHMW6_27370 [Pseudoduganella sp. UC29_106]|uniref:hypothetical protein n=1 Tax=Pseudoduganella sp. UC29_106 TaxID=3374553 RepID=UPI0037582D6B